MSKRITISEIGVENFLLNIGLYESIHYDMQNNNDMELIAKLTGDEIRFDCYCPNCRKERTFISAKTHDYSSFEHEKSINKLSSSCVLAYTSFDGFNTRTFYCSMCKSRLDYWLKIFKDIIIKIGQFPSLAHLTISDIDKYKKVLSRDDLVDIKRGIGLNAHGIGAGAFVYLRRVFESLVEKAYNKCQNEENWDTSKEFYRIVMKEKIDSLKSYLPQFLYENKAIYSILSAGIHSLEEQYCKDNFHILKEAIIVILDQELRKIEDEEREKRLSSSLNKLNSEIPKKI